MTSAAEATIPSEPARDTSWNLYQRIAAIAGKADVKMTGNTGEAMGNRSTVSIADVDRALGPLMDDFGVVSDYEFIDEPKLFEDVSEKTYSNGQTSRKVIKTWRVHIWGYLINVDNPPRRDEETGKLLGGDYIRRELWDDGTNISGAVSFALKRWHRETFHLAEDDTSGQVRERQAEQESGGGYGDGSRVGGYRPTGETRPMDGDPRAASNVVNMPPPRQSAPADDTPKVSGAQLASRGHLYDLMKALGRPETDVDKLLDTPLPDGQLMSPASLKRKLDIELAKKRAAESDAEKAAKEAKPEAEPKERDPDQLVCPRCGRPADGTDAPRVIGKDSDDKDRWLCAASVNGCGFMFGEDHRLTYAKWLEFKKEIEEAAKPREGETELERLAREAKRPVGRTSPDQPCLTCAALANEPHTDDCPSLAAEMGRGSTPAGAAS